MERREFLTIGALAAVATSMDPRPAAAAGSGSGWFDVTAFGAIGDGTTDCTEPIRRAIDAARKVSGGVVRFPAGVYMTSTLVLHGGLTLEGVGWQTTLKLKPSTNANLIETPRNQCNYYGVLRDLTLDGNSASNQSGSALRLFSATNYRIDGIKILNAATHGISLAGDAKCPTVAPWISNSLIVKCGGNGIDVEGFVCDCKIHAIDIGWCDKGVILPNSSFLSDVTIWQCRTGLYGYWAKNSHLHQVRVERSVNSGFRFDGCTDTSLEQCRAYENNQANRDYSGFEFRGTKQHPSCRLSIMGCMSGLRGSDFEKQAWGFTDCGSEYVSEIVIQGCVAIGNKRGGYAMSTQASNQLSASL